MEHQRPVSLEETIKYTTEGKSDREIPSEGYLKDT